MLGLLKMNFKLYIVTLPDTQRRGGGTGRADFKGGNQSSRFFLPFCFWQHFQLMRPTHISHELKQTPRYVAEGGEQTQIHLFIIFYHQ